MRGITFTRYAIVALWAINLLFHVIETEAFLIPNTSSVKTFQPKGYEYDTLVILNDKSKTSSSGIDNATFDRRDALLLGTIGTAYAKIVADAFRKLMRGDIYPLEHEKRVSEVFERAIITAARSLDREDTDRHLRVLEIGIGENCRTIMRGMYDSSLISLDKLSLLSRKGVQQGIDFYGVDTEELSRDVLSKAKERMIAPPAADKQVQRPVSLEFVSGDICNRLDTFPDGFFDAITCSLVLCSVEDQHAAINEIMRLLNPNTGSFAYVEHVAVDLPNERNYSFLEWQQRVLDPLQQLVAHNCHLHRETDKLITYAFTNQGWESLSSERFFVDDMFPISCQSCGVLKRP